MFNLSQNKQNGDIYFSSIEFTDIEWLSFKESNGKITPIKITQMSDGHLSIHKSGQTRITSSEGDEKLIINGNYLFDRDKKSAGIRHLFTLFSKKVETEPVSGAGARKSDFIIESHKPLRPFVLVAIAIPNPVTEINFQPSFNIEDLDEIPGDIMGFINVSLVYHDVFIFAYRTKNMDTWPKKHMIQYTDGTVIPLFFGTKNNRISPLFVVPGLIAKSR